MENVDIYPIEIIKSSMYILKKFPGVISYDRLRFCIPYLLQKMGDNNWIPLNRDYKPIGITEYVWISNYCRQGRGMWADYSQFEFLFIPENRINLSPLREDYCPIDACFFYSDSCTPLNKKNTQMYLERVEKVLGISLEI